VAAAGAAGAVDEHVVVVVEGRGVEGEVDGGRPGWFRVASAVGVSWLGSLMKRGVFLRGYPRADRHACDGLC
jgi:hypothetical protein